MKKQTTEIKKEKMNLILSKETLVKFDFKITFKNSDNIFCSEYKISQ